jgi:hypothetical protein
MVMSAPAATSIGAVAARAVDHDRLDQVIARIAAGDRAAFRDLYAFMAMRVWDAVTAAPLPDASAVAVTRSTFVEVWHAAGAAARYDARDWLAALSTGRINDRLAVDANGRHLARARAAPDGDDQPASVADYDAHIHRELTALLGCGRATIRIRPGVFVRIEDLDCALAAIAAARKAGADHPPSISRGPSLHATNVRKTHVHRKI